jgi:hypothetical protein
MNTGIMSSQLPDHGATTPKKSKQYSYANRKLGYQLKTGQNAELATVYLYH